MMSSRATITTQTSPRATETQHSPRKCTTLDTLPNPYLLSAGVPIPHWSGYWSREPRWQPPSRFEGASLATFAVRLTANTDPGLAVTRPAPNPAEAESKTVAVVRQPDSFRVYQPAAKEK